MGRYDGAYLPPPPPYYDPILMGDPYVASVAPQPGSPPWLPPAMYLPPVDPLVGDWIAMPEPEPYELGSINVYNPLMQHMAFYDAVRSGAINPPPAPTTVMQQRPPWWSVGG